MSTPRRQGRRQGKVDIGDARAALETGYSDFTDLGSNGRGRELLAPVERKISNLVNIRRDRYLLKIDAIGESTFANTVDVARYVDGLQIEALGEGVCANACDAVGQLHLGDVGRERGVWHLGRVGVIVHRAKSAHFQHAVLVFPEQMSTARAEVEDIIINRPFAPARKRPRRSDDGDEKYRSQNRLHIKREFRLAHSTVKLIKIMFKARPLKCRHSSRHL